jgi:hypothetical protein
MIEGILLAVGTILGILIKSWFARPKASAQTKSINAEVNISVGEAWEKYALQMKDDLNEFKRAAKSETLKVYNKYKIIQADYNDLIARHESTLDEVEKLKAERDQCTCT